MKSQRPWVAVAALAALVAVAGPARGAGQAAEGPEAQLRASTDKILAILRSPELKGPEKKEERRQQVIAVVNERFNWTDMAQRALAQSWWPRTPQEREEFVKLFTELVRRTYMSKIEGYSGEKVQFKGQRVDGNYARVDVSIITSKGTDIPVEYSMKNYGGDWLIYDIAVEGVRLVSNYRSQFSSMLNGMSYPEFVVKLKAKVAELKED